MPHDNLNMKKIAKTTVTVAQLEEDIFETEGVRVVLRVDPDMKVACAYSHMFDRGLGNERRIELLVKRIQKIIGVDARMITVVHGSGTLVLSKKMLLGKIRDSYLDA